MRIYPIFHILLLEPAPANAKLKTNLELEDNRRKYKVESILDSKTVNRNPEYLIKWMG